MRALVIGGSVAGSSRAACCATRPRRYVLQRAVGDLAGRGAGLGISTELLEVMARAGARFDASSGVSSASTSGWKRSGEIVFRHLRNSWASAWARVYQPLRAALPAQC